MKTKLSILLTIAVLTCFALPGMGSNPANLLASQQSQVLKDSAIDSSDCDWPMFGRTPEGNRVAPDGCGPRTDKLELKWSYESRFEISTSPVLSNDKVYFGSLDHKMYCLNEDTGKKKWEYKTLNRIYSTPAISKGNLISFANFTKCNKPNGLIFCINAENANVVWQFGTWGNVQSNPVISNNKVFFGSDDSKFYCLNTETGRKVWSFATGSKIFSSSAVSNGKVYFGSCDKKMYCLNAENGQKIWEYQTGDSIYSLPLISNTKIYFGSRDNKLYCLNAENGKKIWEYVTGDDIDTTPSISNGKIYFGSNDKKLYCLNVENGKKIWEYETNGLIQSSPAISNGRMFFGSNDNTLYCLNIENGKSLWQYETGGPIQSSPIISNDKVFVTSSDSILYCFGDSVDSTPPPDDDPPPPDDDPPIDNNPPGECDWPMFGRTPDGNRIAPDACGPKTDKLELKWKYGKEIIGFPSKFVFDENNFAYFTTELSLYCLNLTSFKIIWKHYSGGDRNSSPMISNGKVYYTTCNKEGEKVKLYCLNANNGKIVWEYETNGWVSGYWFPAISNGKAFFGTILINDKEERIGKLYCLNSETGKKVWEYLTVDEINTSPVVSSSKVYFGSRDKKLYCLNTENGKKVWEYETDNWYDDSSPAISKGKILIISRDKNLYCLNSETGKKIWEYQTDGLITSLPTISNGKVYLISNQNKILCLNTDNGQKIWFKERNNRIKSNYAISDGNLYFGEIDKKLICLNANNGNSVWEHEALIEIFELSISKGRVYFSSLSDMYCFDGEVKEMIWVNPIGKSIESSPAISNGKVFFGSNDTRLYCLNEENGEIDWDFKTCDMNSTSPAITNDKVFFNIDFRLMCLETKSGEIVWERNAMNYSLVSPIIAYDNMYCLSYDTIYCLGIDDGVDIWSYAFNEGENFASICPSISNGKVYFRTITRISGQESEKIYCLNAKTGKKIWVYEIKTLNPYKLSSSLTISNGKLFFAVTFLSGEENETGKLYCLNAENGKQLWEFEVSGRIVSSPAISNGRLYVGSTDKSFYCLDSETGKMYWDYVTGGSIYSSPAISNGKVYFGSVDKKLYCLTTENGKKVWDYETGGSIISSPAISSKKVFVGSSDGYLYCFGDADESGGGSGGSGGAGSGGSEGNSGNAQPSCCDNCNDCDKCMVFKIGSKDWKICRENQPPMSAAPVVFKGKTFLVVKYIADSIGASVGWDAANQIVKLSNPQTNKTIYLQIGNNKALVNDEEVQIDANPDIKPFISGGRTLLPLRFIADNLGLQVTWVDKTKEAIICFKSPECAPGIDFELNDTEGKRYKLSDYRGKPVLIDFSTSWCGFCIKAMPALLSLHKRYDGRIQFFTVDPGEDTETVRQFRDELGVSWPFLVDLDESVRKSLNITGYPTMLLLNGKGQIVYIQDGYNPDIEKILGDQFDKLLAK